MSGRLEAPSSTATGYRAQKRDALQPVVIEHTWRHPRGFVVLVVAIVWNVVLGGFVLGSGTSVDSLVLADACFVPFVLVGIFLLYVGLAERLNRTRWVVSPRALSVIHRPLPFRSTHVSVDRVRAIVLVLSTNVDAGRRELYTVVARTDDEDVDLWCQLQGHEADLRFLCRALAEQLGVPDETIDRRS